MSDLVESKVWGKVRHVFDGPVSASLLLVEAGCFCSIHYHAKRWNSFRVISGQIAVVSYHHVWESMHQHSRVELEAGESIDIQPNVWHRFEVLKSGRVVEVYWTEDGSDVDQNDIVRFREGGRF